MASKKTSPVAYFDYAAMKEVVNLVVANNPAGSKPPVTFLGTAHEYVTARIIECIDFLLSHPDTTCTGSMGFYVLAQDQFRGNHCITGAEETCVSMNIVYDPFTPASNEYVYYRDNKMWRDLAKE